MWANVDPMEVAHIETFRNEPERFWSFYGDRFASLGDKRPNGGNVLTSKILAALPPFDGPKVIFGEACRLSAERLKREGITFRQIPYEIKAR